MEKRIVLCTTLLLLAVWSAGHSQERLKTWGNDSRNFPFQIEKVATWKYSIFVDLIGDTLKENFHYQLSRKGTDPPYFEIMENPDDVLVRRNLDINCTIQGTIHFFDSDGDGLKEIFLPVSKNDSLFLYTYVLAPDTSLKLTNRITIASGHPRLDKEKQTFIWDAGIGEIFFIDIDGDYKKDLIAMVKTPFALYPRGVYAFSYPEGQLIDSFTSGAYPQIPYVADDDNDGFLEMVFSTSTPTNGAEANGYSDLYPYLFVLQLGPDKIQIEHVEQLSDKVGTEYWLFNEDMTGDAQKEFIAVRTESDNNSIGQVRIYNSTADSLINQSDYPFLIQYVIPINFGKTARLLASTVDSMLILIDGNLGWRTICKLPEVMTTMEQKFDIDGDGEKEIAVWGNNQSYLLNSKFKVVALVPGWQFQGTRKETHTSPTQYILNGNSNNTVGVLIHKNRFYWFDRHIRPLVGLLIAIIFVLIFAFAFKEHRQHSAIEHYVEHILQTDNRAIAIIDDSFRLIKKNQQFDEIFDYPNSRERTRNIFVLLQKHERIINILTAWREGYQYARRNVSVNIATETGDKTLTISIDQIPRSVLAKRLYQISFKDDEIKAELEKAKSWMRLAQRVTHDLKNPLGSILLIIQRMRTLVNKKPEDLDDQLEKSFDKISGRVESLRVLTRNFMKFANLEEPQFAAHNLNSFLDRTIETLKQSCPPDIQIVERLAKEDFRVSLDAEQMQSVIENLVQNAINAMPEGGRISVSTRLAHRLQFKPNDGRPQEYAIIEVRDNGKGIPADSIHKIFDLNYSDSKESGGLGLAIVQKIINQHNGNIEVESERDVGSIFSIYLPLYSG